ncbi:MAG TPA: T9SS type A sorting domain-containing protein [Chitinophagales bacterium]|nr:T9SS type A sorting domain-containing protein [Chitinophagales bacterium]
MQRIFGLRLFALLFVLLAFDTAGQTFVDKTMNWNGVQRHYRAYVPAVTTCALVVHLHGYGSNSFLEHLYTGYIPVADSNGFVVAFPDGLVDPLGNQSWYVGWPLQTYANDLGFLSDFIDSMVLAYNIDPSMVFVSGLSNGGFMAFRLACELNAKVAAIAVVSASMTPTLYNACTPETPVPAMMIHGTLDTTIPYAGSPSGVALGVHVDSVMRRWAVMSSCNPTPQVNVLPHDSTTVNGTSVEHRVYEGWLQNPSCELYKIINGQHVNWPGFDASTTNDFSAAREIWRFFQGTRSCAEIMLSTASQPHRLVSVYPNPSDGNFYLRFDGVSGDVDYDVIDALGRVVAAGSFRGSTTHALTQLLPGIYALRLRTGDTTRSLKLMVH